MSRRVSRPLLVRRASWMRLLAGGALIASGAGVLAGCEHKGAAQAKADKPALPKVHVTTTPAEERRVPKLLRLTGTLSSNERTDLAANASGRVIKTLVERGDHVTQGQVLAQLDVRAASLSQAEAQANAASAAEQEKSAQNECQRYVKLLEKGAITQQEYDRQTTQCQTTVSSNQAAVARAQAAAQQVGDATIRAPFAGVIAERFAHVGDYVRPDSRIVTLLVDDPLRLELTIPEVNIAAVKVGTVVQFRSVAIPDRTFQATVKYVGGEIRQTTRDLVVEAITDNKDHLLLPGMFVNGDIPVGDQTLPVVPERALVRHPENTTLFVTNANRLEEKVVQLGAPLGDAVAIADGIKKGDLVVVPPPPNAADGMELE